MDNVFDYEDIQLILNKCIVAVVLNVIHLLILEEEL